MVAVHDHDIVLRGASLPGGDNTAPVLLQRLDQEFIPAVLAGLQSPAGRETLAASRAADHDTDGRLRLYQPVHRVFHVVLLEAYCDRPGQPRLDPRRIHSAGLVLRRRAGNGLEGWMQAGESLRGWLPLDGGHPPAQDPDPARRRPRLRAGDPEIDRRLALLGGNAEPLAERVTPLFVAPPAVCEAAGRTLLYGLVPLTSAEAAENPVAPRTFSDAEVTGLLSVLLKNTSERRYGWNDRTLSATSVDDGPADLEILLTCLNQLLVQLDAFGDSATGQALYAELNRISLPYPDDEHRPAGEVLRQAAGILIDRAPGEVKMPLRWPALSSERRENLLNLAREALDARLAGVVPGEMRFADPARDYRLRALIRVRRDDDCPPDLVWSETYSQVFRIAPWYESGPAAPVQVALPDVSDPGFLRKLKPDVAFSVPEPVFNLLNRLNLADLQDGKKPSSGPGIGLGWICGFNIPIITLCAFIVLSIFLSLLHILFFWLPFVKICIPFPKPGGGDDG